MASSTTITGLSSGIQWADTVDQMMIIESQPVERLLNKQDNLKAKRDAWTAIQGKLEALAAKSKTMDARDELLQMRATSTDTSIVTATATADAVASSHTIEVNALAQAHIFVHDTGWADVNSTSLTGSGNTFTYAFGGTDYSITLGSGATLADLVSKINRASDNPGVTASTIDDGSATNPIHLVLSSDETGSGNTISINDVSTTIASNAFDSANWVTTQTAQDAELRVDGYPAGSWITRESNMIDDIIQGVTLTLKATNTGLTETININEDYTSMKADIEAWVEAYNAVMLEISAKTRYDEENEIQGILMGDGRASSVKAALMRIASDEVPGLEDGARYNNLSSVGVKVGAGGQLALNKTKLQEAMEEELYAVVNLFVRDNGSTSGTYEYFASTIATRGGEYKVTANWDASGKLTSGTIGGYTARVENGNLLVGKNDTDVEGLRILFNYPGGGAGSETATVRIGDPVTTQSANQIDQWTDSIDGLIKVVKDAYEDQIDSIDDDLLGWERRLETIRERLERQFLAMESAVSQAQAQGQWLNTM